MRIALLIVMSLAACKSQGSSSNAACKDKCWETYLNSKTSAACADVTPVGPQELEAMSAEQRSFYMAQVTCRVIAANALEQCMQACKTK